MAKIDLKALRAQAEAAEAAAKSVGLSDEEKEAHELLERAAKAKEDHAAAEQARREVDGGSRALVAAEAAGGRYLVRALDLVSFFPFGEAPALEKFPSGGVVVVRSPDRDVMARQTREVDAKKRPYEAILLDTLVDSIVDPAPADVAEAAKIRPFFEAFPGACANAAGVVLELGGLKMKADKRGRG